MSKSYIQIVTEIKLEQAKLGLASFKKLSSSEPEIQKSINQQITQFEQQVKQLEAQILGHTGKVEEKK